MGKASGAAITQIYRLFSNGTFLASDSAGNSFGFGPLSGLPSGTVSSLKANSTSAFQNYLLEADGHVLTNVTISYTTHYQSCQPSGLTIVIAGSVNWSPSDTGSISLSFSSAPISVASDQAYFGNKSGIQFGFNWNDSASFNPSLSQSNSVLTWNVGQTFKIDPTTVTSESTVAAIRDSDQRKEFFAAGLFWLFYYTGSNESYRTSTSGITWSSASLLTSTVSYGDDFSVWVVGSTIYYASAPSSSSNIYYRIGTLLQSGTIAWSMPESVGPTLGGYYVGDPYITVDSYGNIWISFGWCTPSTYYYLGMTVFEYTPSTGWNDNFYKTLSTTASGCYVDAVNSEVLPSSAGIAVVYGFGTITWGTASMYVSTSTTGGGSGTWSTPVATSVTDYYQSMGAGVAVGSTVYYVTPDAYGNMYYLTYTYGSTSWNSATEISTGTSSYSSASIATDGGSNLYIFYTSGSSVKYISSSSGGSSWTTAETLVSSETDPTWINLAYSTSSGFVVAAWETGSTSPYTIIFAALPTLPPVASFSSKSWSKPGVSPYALYFQNLDEYVSNGNGLLTILQDDLALSGRGLNLDVARLFSTPYGFRGSSPYLYDNYTLTNLGYGWSLNFPWLGPNYVHLTDGQAYPYDWIGSTFTYQGATDFTLVENTGSTYTLYLTNGTVYQFNSAKELTSITDSTGNNTISFSYGSNNYISQITDTIGRVVTFSYNSNNTLKSISSGGRVWSYTYYGNDLSSVTDPVGDVTRYLYGTGINTWLISSVLYPTGGKSTYSYGSGHVGTEVETYYVTSRNIYSSATSLSQSMSISYNITNGVVLWSNATISNGATTQSIQDYNFQVSPGLMRIYDKNGTGFLSKITEYDYDQYGHINDTKTSSSLDYRLGGYWPLDEGTGTTTADLSGNGNTGTLVNSPTWETGASCKYEDCLSFNGATTYVNVTSVPAISAATGITVSAWLYPTTFHPTGYAADGDNNWFMSNGLFLALNQNGDPEFYVSYWQAASVPLTLDAWNLVTFSGTSGNFHIYLNGALVLTSTQTTAGFTSGRATIGGRYDALYAPYTFNGKLDDVRLYERALNTTEINELYSNPVAPPTVSSSSVTTYDNWGNMIYSSNSVGQQTWYSYANSDSSYYFTTSLASGIVGYWPLDEGTGTTTADMSGLSNPGTLVNSPSWQTGTSCKFGDCLSFTGSSDQYVSIPSSGSISFPTSESTFSISFWVKTSSTPSSVESLVSKTGDCSSCGDTGYGIRFESGGTLSAYLMNAGTVLGSVSGSSVVSSGVWHNVVFVDNDGVITLFLDGSIYDTGTVSTLGSILNSNPLTLGSDDSGLYFTGSIDDVRVYGLALSGLEANELYTGGSPSVSFYGNSISSNIHDALIGQADYQNGYTVAQNSNFGSARNVASVIYTNTQFTSNENFTSLTIEPGVTLDTCGNIVRVNGTLTNYGTITDTCDGGAAGATGNSKNGYTGGWGGGAGGRGGAGYMGASGGSGGAGGGIVIIYALTVINSGSINANGIEGGGAGSATGSGNGGGGGGGGGEGGQVYLYYQSLYNYGAGSVTATGGSGGSGGAPTTGHDSTCVAGSSGSNNGAGSGSVGSGGACVYGGTAYSGGSGSNGAGGGGGGDAAGSGSDGGHGGSGGSGANGAVTENQVTETTTYSATQETFYQYNSHAGLLTQKQSHNGGWLYTSYTLNKYGSPITMTNSVSMTTHYHYSSTYDSAYLTLVSTMVGSTNVTQSYGYNSTTGYMLSETDGNGHTTGYTYDNIGRTTAIVDPSVGGVEPTTTYAYNDASNYVTITSPNGNVVKQYYDGLDRLTSIQTYNGSTSYSTTSYTYNWDSQVATKTLPGSSVYTYYYNQDGQQIKVLNPDGSYNTTSYNTLSNTKTVTDDNGHPSVYAYNWNGELLSVKQYYSSTGYYTTSYTYDKSGNLLTTTDANGATTTNNYDDLNRLVKTTYPGSSYQTVSYNGVGDVTGEVSAGGTQLNYTYDALNRLTQVSYPGGSTLAYTYDNDGNVLSLVNSATSTYYTYDALDRLTNQTQVVSGTKTTILYGYDKDSNIKSILYPGSTNVTMAYDFLNRLIKVGTPSAPTSFASMTYTTDGLTSKITYGDGETTTYTYNSMDRPSQIDLKSSTGVKTLDLNYTYDSDGNVKTINTESYNYNWLDELTSSTGGWGTTTYAYDPAGNMLNQTTGSTTTKYTYGTYNELESIGKVNFTYDGNGNTHTIDNKTILWTYNYNYNNRLDQVESNSATVATYTYDGNGMLVRSVETDTEVFAYHGGDRIYTKNTGSGSAADYIYANGMILASLNGTTKSYYHEDALGSVRAITSSTGSGLFSTDYKPFGLTYGASGIVAFEYTGKPTDPVTGLYYSNARFYDSASGRFMTQDTDLGTQNSPLSLNRYIYALDDPMKYVDPTGYYSVTTTSISYDFYLMDTSQGEFEVSEEIETTTTTEYTLAGTGKYFYWAETSSTSSSVVIDASYACSAGCSAPETGWQDFMAAAGGIPAALEGRMGAAIMAGLIIGLQLAFPLQAGANGASIAVGGADFAQADAGIFYYAVTDPNATPEGVLEDWAQYFINPFMNPLFQVFGAPLVPPGLFP
jgi:RHS repeat-associated protein